MAHQTKILEIHVAEKDREVMLRIVNAANGMVEGTIRMSADEAAHHTRGMFQVCKKIKATGTHMVLPGDPEFKENWP